MNACISLKGQRGAAVFALLAGLIIAITAAVLSAVSLNRLSIDKRQENSQTLKQARDNLLGYALRNTPPGLLPCPDFDGDGLSDNQGSGAGATCRTQLGYFPYRTIGTDILLDATSSWLWYGVELDYAREVAGRAFNPSLASNLTLNATRSLAAVIIAPGQSLASQTRGVNDNANRYARYLEGINGNVNTSTYESNKSDTNNDEVIGLDLNDFWSLVGGSVLQRTQNILNDYFNSAGCSQYPWASNDRSTYDSSNGLTLGLLPLGNTIASGGGVCPISLSLPSPDWLSDHWRDQIYYAMCSPLNPLCLNINGGNVSNANVLLISPGIELNGQNRPSTNLTDYFDTENSNADQNFEFRNLKNYNGNFNDVLLAF